MSYIDQGVTGAYRQTWRKGNPRSLLQTILNDNKGAAKEKLWQIFHQETEDDRELILAMKWYWFDNNLRSLLNEEHPSSSTGSAPPRSSSAASNSVTKIQQRIQYEARLALLDLIAPNGKRLADCTGADCRSFTGWYALIAKKVTAKQTVGATMSEDQLYQLWRSATKK